MKETAKWDDGTLGRSEEYVAVATSSTTEVDDALGMQMISIRLQKKLVSDLKKIAEYHGVGYQPMIRDLLNRFVHSELKQILCTRLKEIEAEDKSVVESSTAPVKEFMEKMRA